MSSFCMHLTLTMVTMALSNLCLLQGRSVSQLSCYIQQNPHQTLHKLSTCVLEYDSRYTTALTHTCLECATRSRSNGDGPYHPSAPHYPIQRLCHTHPSNNVDCCCPQEPSDWAQCLSVLHPSSLYLRNSVTFRCNHSGLQDTDDFAILLSCSHSWFIVLAVRPTAPGPRLGWCHSWFTTSRFYIPHPALLH